MLVKTLYQLYNINSYSLFAGCTNCYALSFSTWRYRSKIWLHSVITLRIFKLFMTINFHKRNRPLLIKKRLKSVNKHTAI